MTTPRLKQHRHDDNDEIIVLEDDDHSERDLKAVIGEYAIKTMKLQKEVERLKKELVEARKYIKPEPKSKEDKYGLRRLFGEESESSKSTVECGPIKRKRVEEPITNCNDGNNETAKRKRNRHICPRCDKRLSSKVNFEDHIDNVHEGVKDKYTCQLCLKRFGWYTGYREHKKICK